MMRIPPRTSPADRRAPARCLKCYYVVEGLASNACPECGRYFNLNEPHTFTRHPPFVGWVFWLPGLIAGIGGGVLVALLLVAIGNWGVALWGAVPFSAAAIMAYRFRSKWIILPLLVILLATGMIFGIVMLDITGIFCGLMLAGVFVGPALVGAVAGLIVREAMKATRFSQRSWLPVLVLFLLPLVIGVIEGKPRAFAERSVSTAEIIDASPEEVWDKLVFYEQSDRPRPLLLKLGLPAPLGTSGTIDRVGAITRCIYNKGYIDKRITQLEPNAVLGFEVIEQNIHFEHDVRLVGGRFKLERLERGATRLTLTTVYEPLVAPRWVWRPIEDMSLHALHEFVIEEIRLHAMEKDDRLTSGETHVDASAN